MLLTSKIPTLERADVYITRSGSKSNKSETEIATSIGFEAGKSIFVSTGISFTFKVFAFSKTLNVCACTPWAYSP